MSNIHGWQDAIRWRVGKPDIWISALLSRSSLRLISRLPHQTGDTNFHLRALRIAFITFSQISRSDNAIYTEDLNRSLKSLPYEPDYSTASNTLSALYAAAHAASGNMREAERFAKHAYDVITIAGDTRALWDELSNDTYFLERSSTGETQSAQQLLHTPLWMSSADSGPRRFEHRMEAFFNADPKSVFWLDWYGRRMAGAEGAFGLSPASDEAISKQIASQPPVFWSRSPANINSDISDWIAGAATPSLADPEPQNPIAPIFTLDLQGRISVDTLSGNNEVLRDSEAIDRHQEAMSSAIRAINACFGNAAAATRASLERYRDALGATIDELRPGQVIQRGEALRQETFQRERDERESRDSDLPPLPGNALLLVRAVVAAHNILVALDPALALRDEALAGPDVTRTQVSRELARAVTLSAEQEHILTGEAQDALAMAVDLAPNDPDPASRQSRLLTETFRNFGRKILATLTDNLRKTIWGGAIGSAVVVGAAAVPTLGVGGGIAAGVGTAIIGIQKLRKWAIGNEAKLREMFVGNEPMLQLIDRLLEILRPIPID